MPIAAVQVLRLYAGQYFGERALLTSAKRAANVVASGRVTLLSVSRAKFDSVFGPLQVRLSCFCCVHFSNASMGICNMQKRIYQQCATERYVGHCRRGCPPSIYWVEGATTSLCRANYKSACCGPCSWPCPQDIIDCEAGWKEAMALQREVLSRKTMASGLQVGGGEEDRRSL